MISDVLSDAIQDIERYLREFPDTYSEPELRAAIENVKQHMDDVRRLLDTPPVMETVQ